MTPRPFQQVDVFTAVPYLGNPVAVVLDGEGLSDAQMQQFARWTNLSETTFVLPPTDAQADYRLRIFTPGGELQFAGHPTLGSCHAWLNQGGKPRNPDEVVQQCGVGPVRIRRLGGSLAFEAPPLQRSAPEPQVTDAIRRALGVEMSQLRAAQLLDNGTLWLGLLLDQADTVLGLRPDFAALKALGFKVGVAARHVDPAAGQPALEVRGFAPHLGIEEDPVTGSLNASLAQWLLAEGHMNGDYLAAQGACLGRAGRIRVARGTMGAVWVGGDSVSCVRGQVSL
jgi:PhzF family phenazine biosynthesis protein